MNIKALITRPELAAHVREILSSAGHEIIIYESLGILALHKSTKSPTDAIIVHIGTRGWGEDYAQVISDLVYGDIIIVVAIHDDDATLPQSDKYNIKHIHAMDLETTFPALN